MRDTKTTLRVSFYSSSLPSPKRFPSYGDLNNATILEEDDDDDCGEASEGFDTLNVAK